MEQDIASRLGRGFRNLLGFLYLAVFVWAVWGMMTRAPPSAVDKERDAAVEKSHRQADQYKKSLCLAAAACKKYDAVRLECATAGNFRTCLRIKMGEDASYIDVCSNGEGAPALPSSPETPNDFECFFRKIF
jgi:hypothetical protein